MTVNRQLLLDHLNEYVAGQAEAKKAVSTIGFLHLTKMAYSKLYPDNRVKSSNMLIKGPTGCGKTYMVETMAQYLKLPYLQIDAKSLTNTGYVGESIQDAFDAHYRDTPKEMHDRLPYSVVFIDEFDKLCMSSDSVKGDWDSSLQYSLLKLVEGQELRFKASMMSGQRPPLKTHNMLFVLGGSFAHIKLHEDSESQRRSMGFGSIESKFEAPENAQKQLVAGGMVQELVGRISLVTEVHQLTKDELRYALMDTKGSVYKEYQDIFTKIYRQKLDLTEEEINNLLEEAVKRETGVRSLRTVLDEFLIERLNNCEISLDSF